MRIEADLRLSALIRLIRVLFPKIKAGDQSRRLSYGNALSIA